MQQTKEREIKLLNLVLMALAALCLAVAGYAAVGNMFKAGTDDLFLVLVSLLLALLFAINPIMWAMEKGYIANPFSPVNWEEEEAVAAAHADEHEHGGSNKENVLIWIALLALTAVEVVLAYIHIPPKPMLIVLMGLSVIKAALIVAYFMHLKFERLSFVLTIVPILVVLLCLFAILFPDSQRVRELNPYPQATEQQQH